MAQEAEAAWLCGASPQGHPASLSISFPICQTPTSPGEPLPPGHGACPLLSETGDSKAHPQGHRNNTCPACSPHSLWPRALTPSHCSFLCLLGSRAIRGQTWHETVLRTISPDPHLLEADVPASNPLTALQGGSTAPFYRGRPRDSEKRNNHPPTYTKPRRRLHPGGPSGSASNTPPHGVSANHPVPLLKSQEHC